MDFRGPYTQALDLVGALVARLTDDDLERVTPCRAWIVHDIVEHLVDRQHMMIGLLRDTAPAPIEGDLRTAFAAAHRTLLELLPDDSFLRREVHAPFGVLPGNSMLAVHFSDLITHGWDLTQSLDEPYAPPPALLEIAIAIVATFPDTPSVRGEHNAHFRPARTVAADAPALDRLVAATGRDPRWRDELTRTSR